MQSLENLNETIPSAQKPLFSPFLVDPLRIQGNFSLGDGSAFYNEKHNMIIVNPCDNTVQFYDATTILPLKERETKKIGSLIADFSYHKETDTYLLSCEEAKSIYSYNASSNELKKLKEFNDYASAVEFMSPSYYAFSIQNKELCVGTLENGKIWTIHSKDKSPYYLQSLNKSRLLLATLEDGTVMVYRTNKLPKMPVFCSVKGHYVSFSFVRIQNAMVNGKEIVITIEKGLVLKIWQIRKGAMRLLRIIETKEQIDGFVYLENEKMIVTTGGYESNSIKFWSLTSGKLVKTLDMERGDRSPLFLMKDKNIIGVPRCNTNLVEFIKLYRE